MKICEFCGKEKETESTSIVGSYCIECHKINIGQSREAIQEIKMRLLSEKNTHWSKE